MRAVSIAADGERLSLTVSVGGSVASAELADDPHPAERILSAADRSLYDAKETGRDRVSEPVVLIGAERQA